MEKIEWSLAPCISFQCLGGACIASCCRANWRIEFSKNDYRTIQKLRLSPRLYAIRRNAFQRLKAGGWAYAAFALDENGACKFLDEDGLCALHKEQGARALPDVCRQFPRYQNRIGDVLEYGVRLQCEGMIRILLKEEERLSLVPKKTDEPCPGYYWITEAETGSSPFFPFYRQMKALGFKILQNRFYTFQERLLYLGIVLQALIRLEQKGEAENAGLLVERELNRPDSEKIKQTVGRLPTHSPAALYWLLPLLQTGGNMSKERLMLVERICKNWEIKGSGDRFSMNTDLYAEGWRRYKQLCETRPHIMENLSVTLFHQLAMPLGGVYYGVSHPQKRDLWRNYQFYCFQLAAAQFVTAALYTDRMKDEELASLLSIAFRCFTDPTPEPLLTLDAEAPDTAGLSPLDKISILIKG